MLVEVVSTNMHEIAAFSYVVHSKVYYAPAYPLLVSRFYTRRSLTCTTPDPGTQKFARDRSSWTFDVCARQSLWFIVRPPTEGQAEWIGQVFLQNTVHTRHLVNFNHVHVTIIPLPY